MPVVLFTTGRRAKPNIQKLPAAWFPKHWHRFLGVLSISLSGYFLTPLNSLGIYFLIPATVVLLLTLVNSRHQLVMALLLIGFTAFPFQQTCDQLKDRNDGLLQEITYILENTSPEDTVLTGWRGSGVFRPHVYFYYFLHGEMLAMLDDTQKGDNVIKVLENKQPKIVVYDSAVQSLLPGVQEYIGQHYEPTGTGVLYRRKP